MKSAKTQTFEVILWDQSTQTDENEEVVISRFSRKKGNSSHEEIAKESASPRKDPSYVLSKHDKLSDDSNNWELEELRSKPVNTQNDVKFLVFKEQLDKLLKRCPE